MKIHMIGIGGAGMSGIAEVLHGAGHRVTGSDLKESPYTRRLSEAGVTVYIGHAAHQVGDAEEVVISTAIPSTNPELLEAHRRSIPVVPRAGALARILSGGRSVAVAGTHGKTTTTSMTTHALRAQGENPTALIGGELNDIGSNVVLSSSDLFVAEADESDRSLLHLDPLAAVVTNVEFDHPDFYSSLEDVMETFEKFVRKLPAGGHLVTCADDANCTELAALAPCPVTTYGIGAGDLRAEPLTSNSYLLYEDGESRAEADRWRASDLLAFAESRAAPTMAVWDHSGPQVRARRLTGRQPRARHRPVDPGCSDGRLRGVSTSAPVRYLADCAQAAHPRL